MIGNFSLALIGCAPVLSSLCGYIMWGDVKRSGACAARATQPRKRRTLKESTIINALVTRPDIRAYETSLVSAPSFF